MPPSPPPEPRPRADLRPITLAVAGVSGLLIAAFLVFAWVSWQETQRQARRELDLLNQLVAQTTEAYLRQVETSLRAAADLLIESDFERDARLAQTLRQRVERASPGVQRVAIVSAAGQTLHPTEGERPVDLLAHPVLAELLRSATRSDGMQLGRTFRNPFGDWVIPMLYAVRDPPGAVRAYLATALTAEQSNDLLARLRLPEGYWLVLLRADGYAQLVRPLEEAAREPAYSRPFDPSGFGAEHIGSGRIAAGFGLETLVTSPAAQVRLLWLRQVRAAGALLAMFLLGSFLVYRIAASAQQRIERRRRSAEDALRTREHELRAALGAAALGTWRRDMETGAMQWSREALEIYGIKEGPGPRDMQELARYVHPDDLPSLAQRTNLASDAVRSSEHTHHEHRIVRPDGGVRWLEVRSDLHTDTATGRRYRIGTVLDVTERKHAEAELRDSHELFARIFQAVPTYAAVSRLADGRFVDVNQAYERMMGYARAEAVGRSSLELGTWDDATDRARLVELLERDGAVHDWDLVARTRDGRRIEARLDAAVIELHGERCLISILTDLTARNEAARALRRSEEALRALNAELEQRVARRTAQLAEANRDLESFSYSIAHDLRAPLRAINGFAGILAEDHAPQLPPEAQALLGRVRGATVQMAEMIDGLLRLGNITRQEMLRTRVNLSALAQQAAARLQAEQPQRTAEIRIADGLAAEGDPTLLAMVMDNLLGNAWKFSANVSPARIEFGAEADLRRGTVYYVRDNGAGFDMAYAGKLFGVFQRLHGVREFPGTGIGLSTVQRILRRHAGHIWVNAAPGMGATFYFTLWEDAAPQGAARESPGS